MCAITPALLLLCLPGLAVLAAPAPGTADPAQLARSHGYLAEAHTARTEDGHLLAVFRVRNASATAEQAEPAEPVLLVPGLACNAAIWVLLGPGKALAYLLADRGYDVWLADYRGGMFSRRHANLTDQDPAFWDFSLDEIGRLDLPALVELVLQVSGRPSLAYIGHSMGASVLTVMAAGRPELAARVTRAYMLAPAVFMGHASQPAVYGSAGAVARLHDGFGLFASGEIPLHSWWVHMALQSLCAAAVTSPLCLVVGGMYTGHDSEQINKTEISFYVNYIPDSISVKSVRHFIQHFGKDDDFRRFDYGLVGNMALYGEDKAPEYDLRRSTFPVSIYYGDNDFLVSPQDVLAFSRHVPNLVRQPFQIPMEKFNHLDFFLAMDARVLLYDQILEDMTRDKK